MKLSNTAFTMVYIPVLLFILHFSSFCYLSMNENMGFAVKLRGKQEKPYEQIGWKAKAWNAAQCSQHWGVMGYLLLQKKKFHNLIPSPRLLMQRQMTSEIKAEFLVSLWDQQSCEEMLQDGMAEGTHGEWAKEEKLLGWVRNKMDILKSKFQMKCWSLLHRVQCKVKSENVKFKRVLLVTLAWDSWQDLMCFVSLIIFKRPRLLSESRQQSEDIKSIFRELLDRTHSVFHHRERTRTIRWLGFIYHFKGNRWDISENCKGIIIFKCMTGCQKLYYLSPDNILDKNIKEKPSALLLNC